MSHSSDPVTWIVDGQVLQTSARFRGMGHYSAELVGALAAAPGVDLRVLLTSGLDTAGVAADLARRAPDARVEVLDLRLDTPGDPGPAPHNIAELDRYLRSAPKGSRFLLLSGMQGTLRPVLPSPCRVPRWTLVYDLIPLMFPALYLDTALARAEYRSRLANITGADGLLAISQTVANDLVLYLGVDPERVVTINGAPIVHADQHTPEGRPPDLPEPYVLMPTGNNARKNNDRALRAFEAFNARHEHAYTLVVTSTFTEGEVAALSRLASRVVFTGAVDGAAMARLYAGAAAVLFPPEYEGLGLPILEAMAAGVTIACSDIPVFREITQTGLAFFDPESVVEMADALESVTARDRTGPGHGEVLKRYTWEAVREEIARGTAHADGAPGPTGAGPRRARLQLVGPSPSGDDPGGRLVRDIWSAFGESGGVDLVVERQNAHGVPTSGLLDDALGAAALRPGLALDPAVPRVYVLTAASGPLTLLHVLGAPGVVCLLDLDLADPWAALVRRGLVSPSRLAIEEALTALEPPGASHVLAVLGASSAVVVVDPAHEKVLRALVQDHGLDTDVVLRPYPLTPLPYPGLARHKSVDLVDLVDLDAPTAASTEYERVRQVSRARLARLARSRPGSTAHVRRLGTVPVDPGEPGAVDALLSDEPRRRRLVAEADRELATTHTPQAFAAALVDLTSRRGRR